MSPIRAPSTLNTLFPPLLSFILVTPACSPTSLTHSARSGPCRLASLCEPDKGASRCLPEFITFKPCRLDSSVSAAVFLKSVGAWTQRKRYPAPSLLPPHRLPQQGCWGGGLPVKCSHHHRPPPTQCSSSLTATAANALNLICEPVHVLVCLAVCVLSVRNGIHQPLAPVGDPHFPNLDRPVSP